MIKAHQQYWQMIKSRRLLWEFHQRQKIVPFDDLVQAERENEQIRKENLLIKQENLKLKQEKLKLQIEALKRHIGGHSESNESDNVLQYFQLWV